MKIKKSIDELIGNTPLLSLENIKKAYNLKANLIGKIELFNPAGSVKDRVALGMIIDGEKKGIIKNGTTIIEPTSGNTGIGLAAICAQRGYDIILTMPETMSIERRNLLKAYGAKIELTPGKDGMTGAINKATELLSTIPNSYMPGQFTNEINPKTHYSQTGPEIFKDMDGKVDIFVSAIGTGGTITGVGTYLKEQNPAIKIIAVEPFSSPVLSEGTKGPHKIQGIGAGFVPDILDTKIYDEIIKVKDEEAFSIGREVCKAEGLLVGISSGAALFAGIELAKRAENKDKNIVVLLPDTGERYLSTQMFE